MQLVMKEASKIYRLLLPNLEMLHQYTFICITPHPDRCKLLVPEVQVFLTCTYLLYANKTQYR